MFPDSTMIDEKLKMCIIIRTEVSSNNSYRAKVKKFDKQAKITN